MDKEKIKSFTDLHAWKEGHLLVLMIYEVTEKFPQKELFGLISQMRRAAISVTSNIAEGFSRSTAKDKHNFYCIAQGSLAELQNQLLVARDVQYINRETFQKIANQTVITNKILNGLKRVKYAQHVQV